MPEPQRFHRLDVETAPTASRSILRASTQRFGFLPSPLAYSAASPALLCHLLAGFTAFEQTSLTFTEREVVAMTVAFEQGCHYCMALHSALLAPQAELAPLVTALRAGSELPDARLEAVRTLVKAICRTHGQLDQADLEAFLAAGFDRTTALEALLGTCVYLTSTMVNLATRAELDPAWHEFRWEKPV
jgi:AhpD family alkylhydroperoxidase